MDGKPDHKNKTKEKSVSGSNERDQRMKSLTLLDRLIRRAESSKTSCRRDSSAMCASRLTSDWIEDDSMSHILLGITLTTKETGYLQ